MSFKIYAYSIYFCLHEVVVVRLSSFELCFD